MIDPFRCTLRLTRTNMKLLVTSPEQGDVLKAQFDSCPCHPRALLTLLEGLSLWSGHRLHVALDVEERSLPWHDSRLFGDAVWPAESALVQYRVVHRDRRQVRLPGIGDFREIRKEAL